VNLPDKQSSEPVVLQGQIIVPASRLSAVQELLEAHIELTRKEAGCLVFEVNPGEADACVFDVYEEFTDKAAFDTHQKRVQHSEWGRGTGDVVRNYQLSDSYYMYRALELAAEAEALGEVPVGALIVRAGEIIGEGYNQPISQADPSAHAEINAMRHAASKMQNYRLPGTTLYCTIEPCAMCAGAMVHARIERLVYGAPEPRAGAVESAMALLNAPHLNHRVQVGQSVLQAQCAQLISQFFRHKRSQGTLEDRVPD